MSESEKRIPPFGLRLPPELKERVHEAAWRNNRSMNAEIIARLEASFEKDDQYGKLLAQADETDRRLALLETYFREAEERRLARDQERQGEHR
jgi:hypothetical protein